jgi:hypothetical protein
MSLLSWEATEWGFRAANIPDSIFNVFLPKGHKHWVWTRTCSFMGTFQHNHMHHGSVEEAKASAETWASTWVREELPPESAAAKPAPVLLATVALLTLKIKFDRWYVLGGRT